MDADFIELLADKKELHEIVDALPEGSKGLFVWVRADKPNVVSRRFFGTLTKMFAWEMMGLLQFVSHAIYTENHYDPDEPSPP